MDFGQLLSQPLFFYQKKIKINKKSAQELLDMNRTLTLILFIFFMTCLPFFVLAVCPVCTVAVACGVGLSRWLGIDDLISGTWIGGLIVSTIILILNWLKKKNNSFKFDKLVISLALYLLIIIPLYYLEIIGHPFNKLWGIDKLLLGILGGSLFFILGNWLNIFLKKKNQGKVFFPFQKVVLPILFLLILSLIFKFIC